MWFGKNENVFHENAQVLTFVYFLNTEWVKLFKNGVSLKKNILLKHCQINLNTFISPRRCIQVLFLATNRRHAIWRHFHILWQWRQTQSSGVACTDSHVHDSWTMDKVVHWQLFFREWRCCKNSSSGSNEELSLLMASHGATMQY